MRTPPDHAAMLTGLHTVVEMVYAGRSGRPALAQLLTAAGHAMGASGMSLSEPEGTADRVTVATGAVAWLADLAVEPERPPPGLASWESGVGTVPPQLHPRLREQRLHRLLGARVARPDGAHGTLRAYFPADESSTTPEHHTMLRFVSSCAACLYPDAARLPIADAPLAGRAAPAPGGSEAVVPVPGGRGAPTPVGRGLILAATSHELRTPVTAIKGFAETLERHWDALTAAERQDGLRAIRRRAGEVAALVDRLLAAAVAPEPAVTEAYDLVPALREAAERLPGDLRERLRVELPPELPPAAGDRNSIGPVLAELVTNAARHSVQEVALDAAADDQTVLFRVRDRGTGIAAQHVERAFARYWRAEPGDGGGGLGLYLVRRIVERQAGWVSLRPRRSGGTVAEVTLLRADALTIEESGPSREA